MLDSNTSIGLHKVDLDGDNSMSRREFQFMVNRNRLREGEGGREVQKGERSFLALDTNKVFKI